MCGIFAVVAEEPAALQNEVFEGLKKLEYRGYDSWGLAWCDEQNQENSSQITFQKSTGKIEQAVLWSHGNTWASIGHTRWATHGGVTEENAHPHLDCDRQFAVVHNGIVENADQLAQELQGHHLRSQTDTEVIAHLFEMGFDPHRVVESTKQLVHKLRGYNSFVLLHRAFETVIGVKQGSPLIVGHDSGKYYIVSDSVALPETIREVHYLEDEECVILTPHTAELRELKNGQRQTWRWQARAEGDFASELGNYPHYLLKEISEQPLVIEKVCQQATYLQHVSHQLQSVMHFIGCGTAFHACLLGAYLWANSNKLVRAIPGSEVKHFLGSLKSEHTTCFISQSGETIDLVEAAALLRQQQVPFMSVVNRPGSTLARMCETTVYTPAGAELSVLATKSFIAQISTLLLLSAQDQIAHRVKEVQRAAAEIEKIISSEFQQNYIVPVAKKLMHSQHLFTLGRGTSYPIALEAALKIKEVTYLHVEGFAGGELKHGVLALIEEGTPVIAFVPDDVHRADMISNVMEIKARGGYIIGCAAQPHDSFSHFIPITQVGSATILPQTVVSQLLAYHMALLLGRDIDKPRNLAKSVTVK